jgi:hypothetical protein
MKTTLATTCFVFGMLLGSAVALGWRGFGCGPFTPNGIREGFGNHGEHQDQANCGAYNQPGTHSCRHRQGWSRVADRQRQKPGSGGQGRVHRAWY